MSADYIVCQIGATDYGELGEGKLIGLQAEPSGAGVIGTASIELSATGGGGYAIPVSTEVKIYTVNEAQTQITRRVLGGFVSGRTTSARYPSNQKTFSINVVDYNILLKRLVGRAQDIRKITIAADTFSNQIIDAVLQTQIPPPSAGAPVLIDTLTAVAELLGAGVIMPELVVKGKSLGSVLRLIMQAAIVMNPYLRPAFYIGLDPANGNPVGSPFLPTLHVYDMMAAGARAGDIERIYITNGGSGYLTAPLITFTGGGGGTGLAATAFVDAAGKVTYIFLTNPGAGYTSVPAVVFDNSGTGGTGAAATAIRNEADIYFNELGTGTAPDGSTYKTWIGDNGFDRTSEGDIINWRQSTLSGSGTVLTKDEPNSITTYPNPYDADGAWKDEPIEDMESGNAERGQGVLDRSIRQTAYPREMNDLVTTEWILPGQKVGVSNDLEGLANYIYRAAAVAVDFGTGGQFISTVTLGNRWLLPGEKGDEELGAPPIEFDRVPPFAPENLALTGNVYNALTGLVDLTFTWDASVSRDVRNYQVQLLWPNDVGGFPYYTSVDVSSNSILLSMPPNTTFRAIAFAVDYSGNWSAESNAVSGTSALPVTPTLFNGSFELPALNDSSLAAGWTPFNGNIVSRRLHGTGEGNGSVDGEYYYHVERSNDTGAGGITSTKFAIEAGGSYELNVAARHDTAPGTSSTLTAYVRFYDGDLVEIDATERNIINKDLTLSWVTKTTGTFTAPSNAIAAEIVLQNDGGSNPSGYQTGFDDVTILRVATQTRAAQLSSRGATKLYRMWTPEDLAGGEDAGIADVAMFNAALAALPVGSTVRLQGRQYLAPGTVIIPQRINIEGEGGGFTQSSAGTTAGPLVQIMADDVFMSSVRLLGSETDGTWVSNHVNRCGIYVGPGYGGALLEGIYVQNKAYGVMLYDAQYCSVDELMVRGFFDSALTGPTFSYGVYLGGVTAYSGWHSIKSPDVKDMGGGVVVTGTASYNFILNARVHTVYDNGIYNTGGSRNEVIGARVTGSGYGTGVKSRGPYQRMAHCHVEGTLFGFAVSGAGYGGVDVTPIDIGTYTHNGVVRNYCGIGIVVEDCYAKDVTGGGIEIQNRIIALGGPEAYPIGTAIRGVTIEGSGSVQPTLYGALIRGPFTTVHDLVIDNYQGSTYAIRFSGEVEDLTPSIATYHAYGQEAHNIQLRNSNGGFQWLLSDDGVLDGVRVEGVAVPGIYMAGSSNNAVYDCDAVYDLSGVGNAFQHDAYSLNNLIYNNHFKSWSVDPTLNTFWHNTIDENPPATYDQSEHNNLQGESLAGEGMSGLYDHNMLTNIALVSGASVTIAITGAGTYTNTVAEKSKLFDAEAGQVFTLNAVDGTTTQLRITVDTGATQPTYGTTRLQPFAESRLGFNSLYTYFKDVLVEASIDGSTWYAPAGGEWHIADVGAAYAADGYWFGGLADPLIPGNLWRYVRWTFTDLYQDAGYANKDQLWLAELGLRNPNAPYARQYLSVDGSGSMLGNLIMAIGAYIKVGSVAALPTASSTYRGMLARVEGGVGVADVLYFCEKNAANAYAWNDVPTLAATVLGRGAGAANRMAFWTDANTISSDADLAVDVSGGIGLGTVAGASARINVGGTVTGATSVNVITGTPTLTPTTGNGAWLLRMGAAISAAGTIPSANGLHVNAFTNPGGNTVTTAISMALAAQTIGTTNWSLNVYGNAFFATMTKFGAQTVPTSILDVAGPIATAITTTAKTGAYTITATDSTVLGDTTGSAFTITLPTAVGCTGRQYTIKRVSASANNLTVGTTSSQTIDGATTYVLAAQFSAIVVQSDNAGWQILAKF